MSAEDSIRMLLAYAEQGREVGAEEWRRAEARAAWVRETTAALYEAQLERDKRCAEAVDRLDPEAFERLLAAEQAKVDAIQAQLQAVIDEDKWPRGLYFGGL